MQLKIIQSPTESEPWFANGLQFTCTQCGNCCSGSPGYVWITNEEIAKVAKHLKISRTKLIRKYCRKIGSQYSLKESRHPQHGGYDCVFVEEIPAEKNGSMKKNLAKPPHLLDLSRPSPAMPNLAILEGNLATPKAWALAARKCHGMNRGKKFDLQKIEQLRDAEEWPKNPPTS